MFDASEPDTWQCAEEIPVVVVQIGYWYVCMINTSMPLPYLLAPVVYILWKSHNHISSHLLAGHREIGPSAFEMLKPSTVRKIQELRWWYQTTLGDIITTMQPPC